MEKDCTSKLIINFGVEFFFREKDRTSKLIIKMQGQMTSIYNPETPSKKNYLFLHRYILYFNWSATLERKGKQTKHSLLSNDNKPCLNGPLVFFILYIIMENIKLKFPFIKNEASVQKFVTMILLYNCSMYGFMVFNTTFNNITVISWWSVLLLEETGVT
jgi:hypothetical protein